MSDTRGVLIIGPDAVLKGRVSRGTRVEVRGYLEGGVQAGEVVVHEGGRLFGEVKSDRASIAGTVQGDVRVRELISIRSTGNVSGNVKYGRLAMEEGAELAARVRNIPPSIEGDLDITVAHGGFVRITLADLNAVDPDDAAQALTFTVGDVAGGHIALLASRAEAVAAFTQTDLEAGRVVFVHDMTTNGSGHFRVSVRDAAGASSGPPVTVRVAIWAASR